MTTSSVFPLGTKLPAGETSIELVLRKEGYNTFSTFTENAARVSTLFSFHLFLDREPPTLTLLTPGPGSTVSESALSLFFSVSEDVDVLSSSSGFLPVGHRRGGENDFDVMLSPGENRFEVTLRDAAGNTREYWGDSAFRLVLDAAVPPPPVITAPALGSVVRETFATVRGTAPGNAAGVEVSGRERRVVPVLDGTFKAHVLLSPGTNVIRAHGITASGRAGPDASTTIDAKADAKAYERSARFAGAPMDSTISFLRQRQKSCEWVRADPAIGWEEVVLRKEGFCRGARIIWTADGAKGSFITGGVLSDATTGTVWWSAYRDPAHSITEIELATRRITEIPIDTLGSVHTVSYNRYGQLVAWTVNGDDSRGWVSRKYRRDSAWRKFVETSAPTRDKLVIPQDTDRPKLGRCYNDTFRPRIRVGLAESSRLNAYLGREPRQHAEEWVRPLANSPFVYLSNNVTPPHVRGREAAILVGGSPQPLAELGELEFRPTVRGRYMLAVTTSPASAYLYDLATGKLLWTSDEAVAIEFWPRFHGCIEVDGWEIEAP